MEENDKRILARKGILNLLVDSSVYHEMQKIEDNTGYHPLDILENYPKIQIFFTQAMINENVAGKMGFSGEVAWMFDRSLNDEGAFSGSQAQFLYNHQDGSIKSVVMNNISSVDYGQILVTQNHKDLVLLTNDHKMLKSAGALLSNRLMDLPNLLELMVNTENDSLRKEWKIVSEWYSAHGGYQPPKTIHYIDGILRDPHPLTGDVHIPEPKNIRRK